MKRIIRRQGVAYFVAVICLFVFFSFFFVDNFIARMIEKTGSAMVGAKVDLEEADLTFSPFGLKLQRLQVTNPEKPMRNAIEIDRIAMTINTSRLLEKRIIIEEMAAGKIRPDTPRKKSGALPEYITKKSAPSPERADRGINLPNLDIPDVKEILGREKLKSIELAAEYREKMENETAQWQNRLAELPDKDKLENYGKRLEDLKGSSGIAGFLGGAAELVSLRKEIQADLNRLHEARDELKNVLDKYQKRLTELKSAPQQDINRLVDTYSPSKKGVANLGALIFGPKIGSILQTALSWYEKAGPLLARASQRKGKTEIVKPIRGRGAWVRFEEKNPVPDFLIRRISASVEVEAGNFDGTIKNITPDQDVLGEPLYFDFAGKSLKNIQTISFNGIFNHVNPKAPKDSFNVELKNYLLKNKKITEKDTLPITIEKALVNLNGQAALKSRQINADLHTGFQSADFKVDFNSSQGIISRNLADALTKVKNITVQTMIEGTVDDYKVRINSNLDKILQNAAAGAIKSKIADFKKELSEKINAEVEYPLSAAENDFNKFGSISEEITSRLKIGNNILL